MLLEHERTWSRQLMVVSWAFLIVFLVGLAFDWSSSFHLNSVRAKSSFFGTQLNTSCFLTLSPAGFPQWTRVPPAELSSSSAWALPGSRTQARHSNASYYLFLVSAFVLFCFSTSRPCYFLREVSMYRWILGRRNISRVLFVFCYECHAGDQSACAAGALPSKCWE